MGAVGPDTGSTYSPLVAFIYVFNLIMGTGALALPSVLIGGGWHLGALFLLLVACLSYIGVTFVIESMSAANALLFLERKAGEDAEDAEQTTLLDESSRSPFEIVKRTELGQMAEMFFGQTGRIFFYIALILYLFGDAAIYLTFVPRSIVGFMYGTQAPPWAFDGVLAAFILLIVPFCFFDFQKTKPLQVATMGIRNAAVLTIMVLATASILKDGPRTEGVPNFKLKALPNLFGGAVYAFMCHHSLPGIITPMREKALIPRVITGAFVGIFFIYLLLFLSCGAAFGLGAQDPITFNFPPENILSVFLPPSPSPSRPALLTELPPPGLRMLTGMVFSLSASVSATVTCSLLAAVGLEEQSGGPSFSLFLSLYISGAEESGLSGCPGAHLPSTWGSVLGSGGSAWYGWVGDLLFLFPVFTLSSNFPMLSITLRNNLETLLHLIFPPKAMKLQTEGQLNDTPPESAAKGCCHMDKGTQRRLGITLLAVGPPIVCCVVAEHYGVDVSSLVGLTGAYAGAAVMFIIPACLVHCSRKVTCQLYPVGVPAHHNHSESHPLNIHASPFRGKTWVVTLVVAAILAILFISYETYDKKDTL